MQYRIWSTKEDGIDKAYIQINNFTNAEKTQANQFGILRINVGGVFAETNIDPIPDVNFSLPPIMLTIDPSQQTIDYLRTFSTTAETPDPSQAAGVFCKRNETTISDAVIAWKALADAYLQNLTGTL